MTKAVEMRAMPREDLEKQLLDLLKEQFNLRMQRATGELARHTEHNRVRKAIARVKTVLGEKQRSAGE